MTTRHWRPLRLAAIAALLLMAGVIVWVGRSLGTDRPRTFAAIEEQFKYGSIGSEPGVSLLRPVGGVLPPYSVFTALPLTNSH